MGAFKGPTTREEDPVQPIEEPTNLRRAREKEQHIESLKRKLTSQNYNDELVSESHSNKHIIFKFLKKGF